LTSHPKGCIINIVHQTTEMAMASRNSFPSISEERKIDMDCETFRANMDTFLEAFFAEGILSKSKRVAFESHEKECVACAKLLNDREWDRAGDPNDLKVPALRGARKSNLAR